ncbi:MAG: ubiquinol-cytochrome c reductase iron-sulfur subunit [Planctomycetaceae bacterium]|nr:ubiquinol-cytochrome c reductase iron-sulfur subunit [Planctomycetaceae bacterium]
MPAADEKEKSAGSPRRSFLSRVSSLFMAGGLLSGYGMLAAFAGRFLYPHRLEDRVWQYLTDLKSFQNGGSMNWTAPAGNKVVVSRIGDHGTAADFIALSSVCPHLGCAVHWEASQNRFFCPCHNGAFDPGGKPLSGPVKDANQSLATYPLKVERNLLFIEVSTEALV